MALTLLHCSVEMNKIIKRYNPVIYNRLIILQIVGGGGGEEHNLNSMMLQNY